MVDRTGDGAMSEEKHGRGVEQAWRMLDLFASLDVAAFDLTTTDLDGGKREFRRAVSWRALRQWIPHLLNAAMQGQHNLIVRPKRGAVELIQLDDLSGARLGRLWAVAFLILATSEGNHQAWVADCARPAAPIPVLRGPRALRAALISNANMRPIFPPCASCKP